jgi:hypothetical protein
LLPYLTKYVCDEVAGGLRHLPRLHMALRVVQVRLCRWGGRGAAAGRCSCG